MVGLVFGEADGEVLDAVCRAEFFEERDELTQFFNEPVLIISRGDGDQHHHVVGEIVEAVRVREDDKRGRECRVFGEEACAVGIILIAQFGCWSAVVLARYFSTSAMAAFSRVSLTPEMSVSGSVLVAALVMGEALRPKMFLHERGAG